MKILGNPVSSQIDLLLNDVEQGAYLLEVFNMQGQVVRSQQQQLLEGEQRISLAASELQKGLHIVRLSNGKAQISQSIIKQ